MYSAIEGVRHDRTWHLLAIRCIVLQKTSDTRGLGISWLVVQCYRRRQTRQDFTSLGSLYSAIEDVRHERTLPLLACIVQQTTSDTRGLGLSWLVVQCYRRRQTRQDFTSLGLLYSAIEDVRHDRTLPLLACCIVLQKASDTTGLDLSQLVVQCYRRRQTRQDFTSLGSMYSAIQDVRHDRTLALLARCIVLQTTSDTTGLDLSWLVVQCYRRRQTRQDLASLGSLYSAIDDVRHDRTLPLLARCIVLQTTSNTRGLDHSWLDAGVCMGPVACIIKQLQIASYSATQREDG